MKERSPITTHVLDIGRGKAASGVAVVLERREDSGKWKELARGTTNADGRAETLLAAGSSAETGVYRLTFATAIYFRDQNTKTFYPEVTVTFELINATEHYHVPLLVSPFGYSTYRGT